ncbi:MAG: hypothetical protein A49_11850 [Methyloceanibacter sp.]|nr:MAG: hypothetical protein A49_11850 [Methyloceanibacter sp.]
MRLAYATCSERAMSCVLVMVDCHLPQGKGNAENDEDFDYIVPHAVDVGSRDDNLNIT